MFLGVIEVDEVRGNTDAECTHCSQIVAGLAAGASHWVQKVPCIALRTGESVQTEATVAQACGT